jgi:hypothetical protein
VPTRKYLPSRSQKQKLRQIRQQIGQSLKVSKGISWGILQCWRNISPHVGVRCGTHAWVSSLPSGNHASVRLMFTLLHLDSVQSPQRRNQPCVPADKVTLYALGVTAEIAINTLREECYRRLDQLHALLYQYVYFLTAGMTERKHVPDSVLPSYSGTKRQIEQDGGYHQSLSSPSATIRHTTPTRIPISASKRLPLAVQTFEPPLPSASNSPSRKTRLAESLNQSVRRTAGEILDKSPVSRLVQSCEEASKPDSSVFRRNSLSSQTSR